MICELIFRHFVEYASFPSLTNSLSFDLHLVDFKISLLCLFIYTLNLLSEKQKMLADITFSKCKTQYTSNALWFQWPIWQNSFKYRIAVFFAGHKFDVFGPTRYTKSINVCEYIVLMNHFPSLYIYCQFIFNSWEVNVLSNNSKLPLQEGKIIWCPVLASHTSIISTEITQ